MTRYINTRTSYGVETVDQLKESDFNSYKEFKKELRELLNNYNLAFGGGCYISQRCDKTWNA